MKTQKDGILGNYTGKENMSLSYDFNNDGKVDMEDYQMALKYMETNNTENAFGFGKEQIEDIFAHLVTDFSENALSDYGAPISFSGQNSTFHFFEDRDNNGILDDSSELLGAQNGLYEFQKYDLDGNGKIDGDELQNLKLVKINKTTGEVEYMTAQQAGINEIDLSALADLNAKQMSANFSDLSLDIKMLNGETLSTMQNEGLLKPIEEEFSRIFGSKITDYSGKVDDVSYMEDFVKGIDIQSPIDEV